MDLLPAVISSASSPSSPPSPFTMELEKILAEGIFIPSSPSASESSQGDSVNLDDSTEFASAEDGVYEDFAVEKPVDEDYGFVDEPEPEFPTRYLRTYYSERRKCIIYLKEGETDEEFDGDTPVSGNLWKSDLDSSSELQASIEDGSSPKRPRKSVSHDDTERLLGEVLGDDDEEEMDACLED